MRVATKEEENGSDQKTKKCIPSTAAINSSKRSFILARTIDKLSRKFPPENSSQKHQPALDRIPLPRQFHTINQPRKC
ncbi:death-associated protein-like 1-B [Carcharodon carcharias]|uniref:death-associated protein-like 1-B n=1 Tax=Carcharodon carcharias TaxID=13397 RepID=UPI001B7F5DC6|nr:death-associated protein-like 1-B [Carcharodon carcharias]XP_041057323.1 death-associated protein-like 1-B [Carcharodon carcharias]XP_041057324.1 death-associated protein-like 1-B [Carcharodon carcharias]XP_041057325.1 death-associated protein-like 1-B [Carcharodon carcharias]